MAEAVDWKRKHNDVVREMETAQRRWLGIDRSQRRLVGRLCTVAMGDDPVLDRQLERISAACRSESSELELTGLFDALTTLAFARETALSAASPSAPSVASTPSTAPPAPAAPAALAAPAARWSLSCSALDSLLERLGQNALPAVQLLDLRARLAAANDDAGLAAVLARLGDLLVEHGAAIASERTAMAATLAHVTARMQDMTGFLTGSSQAREEQHADADLLTENVQAQMTRLSDELVTSGDLVTLRRLVTDRLETVSNSVRAFHDRELLRFSEGAARSAQMRLRITALETESVQLQSSLQQERRESRIDSLTKVPNRASFDERFAAELARWQISHEPVSVLVWDIDRFKSINDACGHRGGDTVLCQVAIYLSRGVRMGDFFARFGGEEFVTLLIGTSLSDALGTADKLRCGVAALKFHLHNAPVRVTVSCGLTELRSGDSVEAVFDRADSALYRAKNSGRNCCVTA
jgi:diguanylate cyclase